KRVISAEYVRKKRAKADFLSKLWLGYCTACGVNPVKAEAPDPESGFLFETVETPDNMFSESDALSHKGVQLRKATK
ncbi:MAG: hypothetical protein KBS76_01250, partial [Ruminococcus sp.]|nr:hypothetical protein [Candidatus Apopatosoma intestinale]